MANDITNGMLLEHMQTMKYDLLQKISDLDAKYDGRFTRLEGRFDNLTLEMRQGFEQARQHRQALQENLEATMRMLSKHEVKLTRLTRTSSK